MKEIDLTAKYALAVSGGVDSMVMLHKFATLLPRPDFFVVTVNHGIRSEAVTDCEFVANYCKKLRVDCRVFSVDAPAYSRENKVSLETAARILRYGIFDKLECDFVCLAHNACDNAETVLMHVIRGSGSRGAAGIKAQNGRYLRPLLDMSREDIEQYARAHNVPHVEDATNDDVQYSRNFIRWKVMPRLTELNPAAMRNILRFASNVKQDDEYLDSLADVSTVVFEQNCAKIPKQLLTQPAPVAYRVLMKVFNGLGVYYDVEKVHLTEIIALAGSVGGKNVSLPFDFVATNDYDCVTIWKNGQKSVENFEIPFKTGRTETPLGVVEVSSEPIEGALRFDVSKLPENCVFRVKRQGDTFTKFGGGTKSLKKYLIDKKIPERQRDGLLLVACDSDVLIICGVEISERVKVDDGAKAHYIKISKV